MNAFTYRCTDCGRRYSRDEVRYLCPECGTSYRPGIPLVGVLEAVLDDTAIRTSFDRRNPDWQLFCTVEREFHPPLPVGNTPLARCDRLGSELGLDRLWVKNDGLNPSGSLKDDKVSELAFFINFLSPKGMDVEVRIIPRERHVSASLSRGENGSPRAGCYCSSG